MQRLIDEEGARLGERFAGAWLNDDGSITVAITGGQPPERLKSNPRVRVELLRFSTSTLRRVIEEIAGRLNNLLAATAPAKGMWPYRASMNTQANTVDVLLDESQASRRQEIDAALEDFVAEGSARVIGYGAIREHDACSRANCSPFRGGLAVGPACRAPARWDHPSASDMGPLLRDVNVGGGMIAGLA